MTATVPVLDATAIGAMVYWAMSLLIVPLILLWLPQDHPWQDRVSRLAGVGFTYALLLAVALDTERLSYHLLLSLLLPAGAIYAATMATYHVNDVKEWVSSTVRPQAPTTAQETTP